LTDFAQSVGHPKTRRIERAAVIVVENPANSRTIVEHDGASFFAEIGRFRWSIAINNYRQSR